MAALVKEGCFLDRTTVVYIFIDAANMWSVQKSKGYLIDYANLIKYIEKRFNTQNIKVYYYEAYPVNGSRPYSLHPKHKFFAYLNRALGFTIRKKPLKRISDASNGQLSFIEKGNMDVELAIDVIHNWENYQEAILLTGDSDFYALIDYLRAKNRKVYVMSSISSVSKELRQGADAYMDLKNIPGIWKKKLKHRKI